ncbi:MAG: hypothetical protein QOH89_46 [Pseudonocardiales bacterium]|jgi:hypothetical protein|nr:hypothetical protein [Pseudonocardiales bacterium]
MVAVLAIAGWAAGAAPAHAGKNVPKPFHRQFANSKPPVVTDASGAVQFPQPLVQYWGGPVLRTNETFVVFWDPTGALSQSYRDLVVRYFQDVAVDHGDNVYAVLNQYSDTTGPIANASSYAGSVVDTDPFPNGCPAASGFPACFNDSQLQAELDTFLVGQGITRPANRGFFVFTPPGINTCFDDTGLTCASSRFCAYHSNAHGAHGDFLYAIMPFAARPICETGGGHPNGSDADPVINAASHEHREMIDDPYIGDATDYAPPLAWADPNTGDETSDKCAFYFGPTKDNGLGPYNQVINGHQYLLQSEWSNALAADDGLGCVTNASDHPPVAAFTTSLDGPTLIANASGSSDIDPGDSLAAAPYFWVFGDGTAGRGLTVRHKYASPGSYSVNVYVTDSFGATDVETHVVRITNHRPAPTHAFSAKFNVNINNTVFGFGTATGMGSAASDAFGIEFDSSDFPNSFTVFVETGLLVKLSDTFDQIFAPYTITLTDTASPPAGNNYTVTGSYTFQGGQGRYFDASGAGTITGTCTSSFDRPDADCTLYWKGVMAGA